MYGHNRVHFSTVTRWIKQINYGQEDPVEGNFRDRPRSVRSSSAYNFASIDLAVSLIKKNKYITFNELSESLQVTAVRAAKTINFLGI